MRAKSIVVFVSSMLVGSMAQAADVTTPPFNDLRPADAIVAGFDLDVMFANLTATDPDAVSGNGRLLHSIWYDQYGIEKQAYRTVVELEVPAGIPGLDSIIGILSADLRLILSSDGVPYAECTLPVQLISSRSTAIFELYIEGRGVGIKLHKGVCDVDLEEPGIQIGIPEMHHRDLIETIVWADDTSPGHIVLEGYCY